MAVNINIPSQVKTYANLAAFPASGSLKTIYIAEDTNKTYRWTGSVYVEISASAAMTWGQIGGTLSNQTDLQNALDAKVPTARTLTINGNTQDLSANRTFTIPTDLTVGTTPIASGTIGRVLFQGTGNVLQQSSSLSFDSATNLLTSSGSILIGSSLINANTTAFPLQVNFTNAASNVGAIWRNGSSTGYTSFRFYNNINDGGRALEMGYSGSAYSGAIISGGIAGESAYLTSTGAYPLQLGSNNVTRFIIASSGNLLVNTTTDAGFKLDVNGTARVQDLLDVAGTNGRLIFRAPELSTRLNGVHWVNPLNTVSYGYIALSGGTGEMRMFTSGSYFPTFYSNGSERMRIPTTGNLLINTTTDAGFRLDVNGTARVQNELAVSVQTGNGGINSIRSYGNDLSIATGWYFRLRIVNDSNAVLLGTSYDGAQTYLYSDRRMVLGSSSINSSAILQADSTTRGFLPPRMTTTQKNAIATPATGLQVFDTTLNQMSYYNGTTWTNI